MANPSFKLLLVDDDADALEALRAPLSEDGHEILTANYASAALELLKRTTVQVIVSDEGLSGMGGVQFLRLVKALYPEAIRIMLSGHIEHSSLHRAVSEGVIHKILRKPFDREELRAVVRDAVGQHGSH